MTTLTQRNESAHTTVPGTLVYSSRMIRTYQAWLAKRADACILDVGPVCDDSINFFLPQVRTIFICDLFLHAHRHQDDSELVRELDYAQSSFDAIHLWDLIDHLDIHQAPVLIEACYSLLKPGGSILIAAYEEFRHPTPLNAFAIGDNCQVVLRPQHHLHLPYHHWNNRDLIHLMKQFTLNTSFVYQCGVREFYFRRRK